VELLTGALFAISYIWWPSAFNASGTFGFVLWLIFLTAFMALAVYDLRWFLLPDRIVYPLIGLAILEIAMQAVVFNGGWQIAVQAFGGAVLIAGLFYLLFALSRGAWIGLGDVKLAIVLGLLVGGPLNALWLIFIASLLGSIAALPLLIKGQAKVTSRIPFGPFLLAATLIVVLFGSHITDWYNNFLYLY
jgi:leader peptidase (prepilin peptidase)/N-methyltransferase